MNTTRRKFFRTLGIGAVGALGLGSSEANADMWWDGMVATGVENTKKLSPYQLADLCKGRSRDFISALFFQERVGGLQGKDGDMYLYCVAHVHKNELTHAFGSNDQVNNLSHKVAHDVYQDMDRQIRKAFEKGQIDPKHGCVC